MLDVVKSEDLALKDTPHQWLLELKKPTAIEIEGKNKTQWRVVTVLVHGNEPSGFFAAHKFIRENCKPQTNLAIVVASTRAARHNSQFTHRHLPGDYDLNRRFGIHRYHDDPVTALAHSITDYIRSLRPSVVVDLHNTSGHGPAFAVAVSDHLSVRRIVSLFSDTVVVTQHIVGSLMEQNFNCPVVTIECGGAMQQRSHNLAFDGLKKFAFFEDLPALECAPINVIYHPARVKARKGMLIEYGDQFSHAVNITLVDHIENFNEGITCRGTLIGWLDRNPEDCLSAVNDRGENIVNEIFEIDDGRLFTKHDLKIFMATRRADIALNDCIFYAANT